MNAFTADLIDLLGCHAHALIDLLRECDGGDRPEQWRAEVELLLEWGGRGHVLSAAPVFESSTGLGDLFTSEGSIPAVAVECPVVGRFLIWAQHLRLQLGKQLLTYSADPRANRSRKWLLAQVGELLEAAGISKRRKLVAGAKARKRISARWGLTSTTHLPASVLQREVGAELLRLELALLRGGREGLKAALGMERARRPVRPVERPMPDARNYAGGANDIAYRIDRDLAVGPVA